MASAEHSPSSSTHETDKDDSELFGVGNFDDIRAEQQKMVDAELEKVTDDKDEAAKDAARAKAYAKFEAHAQKYLLDRKAAAGEDDPALKKQLAYVRHFSIDNMGEDEWRYDSIADDGTLRVAGRTLVKGDYDARRESMPAPDKAPDWPTTDPDEEPVWPTTDPDEEPVAPDPVKKEDDPTETVKPGEEAPKPPEPEKKDDEPTEEDKAKAEKEKAAEELQAKIDKLSEELEGLQETKHEAFAARMAVSYFAKKKKKLLSEEYTKAEAAYLEGVKQLELLKAQQDESLDQEGINKQIAANITERLKEDKKLQMEAMLNEGGFTAKMLKKYQDMPPKKKIMVAIGIGAFLAAGGAAIAAGLVGGVAATVASGVLLGAKTGRTYATAKSRMYREQSGEGFEFTFDHPKALTTEQALNLATGHLKWESRQDIESADKKKRNAVLFALGTAATGGIVGTGVLHGLDLVRPGPAGTVGGVVGDKLFGGPSMPDVVTNPPLDPDHAWVLDKGSLVPEHTMEFGPNSNILNPGDGGYNLFQRMNVPQEHWGQLWQQVGPDLQGVTLPGGQPFSYVMPNGEWGIRMTPDGRVPNGVLEMIANKHQALFGTNPWEVPSVPGAETIATAVDAPAISPQEAIELKTVLGQAQISPAEIAKYPELFESIRHVAPSLELHRYMTEGLGLPERVWSESVLPYIDGQLLKGDNPLLEQAFEKGGDGIIRFKNGTLSPDLMAQLLNSVPTNIRQNFALAG